MLISWLKDPDVSLGLRLGVLGWIINGPLTFLAWLFLYGIIIESRIVALLVAGAVNLVGIVSNLFLIGFVWSVVDVVKHKRLAWTGLAVNLVFIAILAGLTWWVIHSYASGPVD